MNQRIRLDQSGLWYACLVLSGRYAWFGKFYVESVRRTGANAYQIQTVSAIGVLNNMYHVGGLFTGTTFGAFLAHIPRSDIHGTGNPVIPYDIDDDVANFLSGWLPYATKAAESVSVGFRKWREHRKEY